MKTVDMSEKAILTRLKTVDRLRELCLALMKAKKGPDENVRVAETEIMNKEQTPTASPMDTR